ncbi:PREDICTED: rhomboid-related protein 4-like [Vollenhovia emeryi]|uniref:rhomboid-related protein 4-like n=1 Tax=Vollenhovia emeryi TaxID=411798 RepID=UPI0005F464C0|nr:PREDICTED: rhomboid-related protein 4-like [Vollenhovia emeryi]XP_011861280.1 PREDICTED: rhomboid-related protein 4-like [Vollenhovia emeryi]XP_011861281.1 PREDICTED: rhomboid-related protein 4-like [Vollenhovia emeryi]
MIRSQRRQQGLQSGIFLLCMQVLNFGLDRIPPATLIGVIAQALLYVGLIQVPWNAEDVCISAVKVIKYKNWRSFFLSNFEHGSDMHLYYNMISFILKGAYLEPLYGTTNFVLLLVTLSIGCSAMYVSLGYVLMQLTGDYGYFTACAIGFSATLFALKVIALCEERDKLQNISGFIVPSKLAVWLELLLIHLLVPNSSFIGHLGGILVGCLYSYTFVGETIDNLIHAVTGTPIIHEEQFYRRRNRRFT